METNIHRIPRPIAALLVLIAVVLLLLASSALVEGASIGERSWQFPAVGHTVNGYNGAPVGSPIYRPVQ